MTRVGPGQPPGCGGRVPPAGGSVSTPHPLGGGGVGPHTSSILRPGGCGNPAAARPSSPPGGSPGVTRPLPDAGRLGSQDVSGGNEELGDGFPHSRSSLLNKPSVVWKRTWPARRSGQPLLGARVPADAVGPFLFPPRGRHLHRGPAGMSPAPACLPQACRNGGLRPKLLAGLRLGLQVAGAPRDPSKGGIVAPMERSFRVSGTARTQGRESPEAPW